MPSTLAHVAVQVPLAVGSCGRGAVPWALLGCVVADVGWIAQRAFKGLWRGEQEVFYDVRLAAMSWTSLLASLVLCASLAAWAARPRAAFGLLASGTVVHLALDAVQLRWGNGIVLFAPFEGSTWAPGSAPPDHVGFQLLAVLGLVALVRWGRPGDWTGELRFDRRRSWVSLLLLAIFVAMPLMLSTPLEDADGHSLRTLRSADRTGQAVELYRAHYFPAEGPEPARVLTLVSEPLEVLGGYESVRPERVSMQARFVRHDALIVERAHVHPNSRRSISSLVGLLLLALLLGRWVTDELRSRSRQATSGAGRMRS